jgi:hypothetical protein
MAVLAANFNRLGMMSVQYLTLSNLAACWRTGEWKNGRYQTNDN